MKKYNPLTLTLHAKNQSVFSYCKILEEMMVHQCPKWFQTFLSAKSIPHTEEWDMVESLCNLKENLEWSLQ